MRDTEMLDGSETDITEYCTETTYYQYVHTTDNGYRQVFVVGGPPDDLGWAEFLWDNEGNHLASSAVFKFPEEIETSDADFRTDAPAWLRSAREALGANAIFEVLQRTICKLPTARSHTGKWEDTNRTTRL